MMWQSYFFAFIFQFCFLYHCHNDLGVRSFVPTSSRTTLYFSRGIFGILSLIFDIVAPGIDNDKALVK